MVTGQNTYRENSAEASLWELLSMAARIQHWSYFSLFEVQTVISKFSLLTVTVLLSHTIRSIVSAFKSLASPRFVSYTSNLHTIFYRFIWGSIHGQQIGFESCCMAFIIYTSKVIVKVRWIGKNGKLLWFKSSWLPNDGRVTPYYHQLLVRFRAWRYETTKNVTNGQRQQPTDRQKV